MEYKGSEIQGWMSAAELEKVFGEVSKGADSIWFIELPFKNARMGNSA